MISSTRHPPRTSFPQPGIPVMKTLHGVIGVREAGSPLSPRLLSVLPRRWRSNARSKGTMFRLLRCETSSESAFSFGSERDFLDFPPDATVKPVEDLDEAFGSPLRSVRRPDTREMNGRFQMNAETFGSIPHVTVLDVFQGCIDPFARFRHGRRQKGRRTLFGQVYVEKLRSLVRLIPLASLISHVRYCWSMRRE